MGISSYSTNPASNTSINGINIAEGCAPSGINDAIRQLMADIASGVTPLQLPTATGTANAVVVALTPAITSYSGGQRFQFLPAANSTGAVTINYGGGVINLQKRGGLALALNDLIAGIVADVEYDGTRAVLLNPQQYSHGADIASAATIVLDNATGDYTYITGTTGITAISLTEGREVTTKFAGIVAITNGASLICPANANFTTAAGDVIVWRGEASGVVRAVGGIKASGLPWVTAGIDINTNTTGTLNVNRGGLGVVTIASGGVPIGAGTSPVTVVAAGNIGNVLTDNGTTFGSAPLPTPAAAGSMVYLGTQTAAASATIDFTSLISATYDDYVVIFDAVRPSVNGSEMWLRTSSNNGSSFDASANNYGYSQTNGAPAATTTQIGLTIGNTISSNVIVGASGMVHLYNLNDTTAYKRASWSFGTGTNTGAAAFIAVAGSGARLSASAVNALRFLMDSGNITSGTFKLYGIKKA